MSDNSDTIENQSSRLPSVDEVLDKPTPFPFEEEESWAEAFNHLQFEKGKEAEVKVERVDGGIFKITLPETPSFRQIIEATNLLIREANIDVNHPSLSQLSIFCRELRNTARVLAEIAKTSSSFSKQPDQTQILEFIDSLYQLGEGLEKIVVKEGSKTEEESKTSSFSSESPITSFNDERLTTYELPPFVSDRTTDESTPKAELIENYKNQLLLSLLGKNYQSFAPSNQKDEKLSQVVQNSTYYYLLKRYWRIKEKNETERPSDVNEQIQQFDQWLLDHKKVLFPLLFSFVPQGLQEGGRTSIAFWEIVTRKIFSYLDQAIVAEGWKRAKESLKTPPLFNDLGVEIQETLMELGLLTETKSELQDKEYRSTSLFEMAQKILEKKKEDNPNLSTLEKIKILWDLVQAYKYQKTYKLTTAVEKKAFECNLRSYILGRLYQELMGDEVEVYTVQLMRHTLLLVFDRSANKAYWVDPTKTRFIYKDGMRIPWHTQPFVKELDDQLWQSVLSQINASPDNFNIFGNFDIYGQPEFATILPFRQGIESGFLNNINRIYREQFLKEKDKINILQLINKAYYFAQKALELNPNNPGHHNNIALLYEEKELAEAVVRIEVNKTKGEKLTPEEKRRVWGLYLSNLLKAEEHYKKAIELDPNN